jgi:hypothetical protein
MKLKSASRCSEKELTSKSIIKCLAFQMTFFSKMRLVMSMEFGRKSTLKEVKERAKFKLSEMDLMTSKLSKRKAVDLILAG